MRRQRLMNGVKGLSRLFIELNAAFGVRRHFIMFRTAGHMGRRVIAVVSNQQHRGIKRGNGCHTTKHISHHKNHSIYCFIYLFLPPSKQLVKNIFFWQKMTHLALRVGPFAQVSEPPISRRRFIIIHLHGCGAGVAVWCWVGLGYSGAWGWLKHFWCRYRAPQDPCHLHLTFHQQPLAGQ